MLSLPVAALGAYLGVVICGLENDIYFQIGLVMLVGLAAKNAILIVEFAKVQVDKGGDLIQSAIHAAQLRFRPILMTSLAFVLGMLPMVLASGPGSASRQAIGTGVFFGMIFAMYSVLCLYRSSLSWYTRQKQKCSIRLRKTDFKDNIYEKKEHIYYFVAEYVCPYLMQGGQELCASGDGIAR